VSISNFWNDNKKTLANILHPISHIGSLIPLGVGLWDFWQNNLGANPILEITHRSGKTAFILLMLSLSISPLRTILNWPQANKLRRPLGLYAFTYAAIHFAIYLALDYGFDLKAVIEAITIRPFTVFGFTAGLILLILAITSLTYFQKKLKKRWKTLHRFVYGAGVLVGIHFILAVKPGVLRPWPYAIGMLILLAYRIPVVQSWVKKVARA
jgi:sulfoxide reductase heme-binding subunit YedZ